MRNEVFNRLFSNSNITSLGTNFEKNGGTVRAENELNNGSVFIFTIPYAKVN